MTKQVRVFAPATIANLGPGYDVLGIALESPGDIISAEFNTSNKVEIVEITGYGQNSIPTDPIKNTAGIAARVVLDKTDSREGVTLRINKGIHPGSGLGSSAASAAGSAYAVNRLLGDPLANTDLIMAAAQGETAASGVAHADNVSPAILGGVAITYPIQDPTGTQYRYISIPPPQDLMFTIVRPTNVSIRTEDARNILPREIPLKDAVYNLGSIAGWLLGMITQDLEIVGQCTSDHLVEPYRAPLIPGFGDAKKAALQAGALGVAICGSGPAILAISDRNQNIAQNIGDNMKHALSTQNVTSQVLVTAPSKKGACELP